uniref:Protein kinase domain-containing protein n=1 Tax=Globisporangium ultimum (strain ATCC 200006 / CBS 805.95 / DAOM BR144) TaxID=431595 RepID=K3X9P4_GLOUD
YLDLGGDSLTELPEDFSTLQSLAELHLQGNVFKNFPAQIFQLGNLSVLDISGNGELSGLTFTREQVAFLSNLTLFVIDPNAFAASCAQPEQVHGYSICVSDPNDSSKLSFGVWILIGIGILVVIALVAMFVWRKWHMGNAASEFESRGSGKKLFCLGDVDADSILESSSPSVEEGYASSEKFSSHHTLHTRSSKGSNRFASIWDDEELLRWRIDGQQVHDVRLLATGFYGEVWLSTYLGKEVAVKRLKKSP